MTAPATHASVIVETRLVNLAELRPHPDNPNNGDVEEVAASLATNRQYRSICVNVGTFTGRPQEILAGHTTVAAALSLGWAQLRADLVDVDDEAARRILAADNRLARLARMDPALEAALLAGIEDLTGTGYDADYLAELQAALGAGSITPGMTDPDDAPAIPITPPITQVGQVLRLGPHRLAVGDARDRTVVLSALDGQPVDMLLTDPPYGVGYVGKTADRLTIDNDELTGGPLIELLEEAFTNARAALRPGAPFYVFGPNGPQQTEFRIGLHKAELAVHAGLVWVKDRFVLGRQDYQVQHDTVLAGTAADAETVGAEHEEILYGWAGGSRHPWVGGRRQTSVLEFPRPARSTEHPTMKPVALLTRLVLNSTRPGDLVFDPFAGSGSTLIACYGAGRRAALVEIDPVYADVICRRWQQHTGVVPVDDATGLPVDMTAQALP